MQIILVNIHCCLTNLFGSYFLLTRSALSVLNTKPKNSILIRFFWNNYDKYLYKFVCKIQYLFKNLYSIQTLCQFVLIFYYPYIQKYYNLCIYEMIFLKNWCFFIFFFSAKKENTFKIETLIFLFYLFFTTNGFPYKQDFFLKFYIYASFEVLFLCSCSKKKFIFFILF